MKKSTFSGLFVAALLAPGIALAQDVPSASTDIYNQAPWANDAMLELFAKAADEGRAYPTQEEFEAAGVTFDLEYVRSHTRQRSLIEGAPVVNHTNFNASRRLWMNLPGGFGKDTGGYPSTRFNNDVYSMWNYTHIFGSWNYGFLLAPGSWVDAAHRNGTRIYSGIKFFESWTPGSTAAGFAKFITTKNADGSFRYVDAMINACAFFGGDGLNYNMEDNAYTNADWIAFHAQVKKRAKERGLPNFGVGMYTQNSGLTDANAPTLLGGNTEDGAVYDCMLNYSSGDFAYTGVSQSLNAAKKLVGNADDVYQGCWIVTMDRNWQAMNASAQKGMNICLWGEHDQSRFFQYAVGTSLMNIQENYQTLLERSFSGGNRNPLNRPALSNSGNNFQVKAEEFDKQMTTFGGLATLIPERSAIGGNLPFQTHFSLGNGDSYFYNGKITHSAWYNMSQQDVVPTYRWLVTKQGDMTQAASDIDVHFTHEDSYVGGSSLRITGNANGGNDLILYHTALKASKGAVNAELALKGTKGASNLSLLLKKKGSDSWIVLPAGDLASNNWEVKKLAVSGLAEGDVIEYIGLRVNSSKDDYKVYVGKIKLSDDFQATPASIKKNSLNVEIKEETPLWLSVKLNWEPDYSSYTTSVDNFGMVYNDEINVDHFEILYKEGENGRVKEVGRTAQWAAIIGKIRMDQTKTNAYIGVRAVSTDLKTYSDVEWVAINRYQGELPEALDNSLYGETYLFNVGNSNKESIQSTIYWEDIKTTGAETDLNYHADANPCTDYTQYYYAQDHKLVVKQGQKISLFLKAREAGSDCLKYDWVKAYIDFDGNYNFLDADEVLFTAGNQNSGTEEIANPGLTYEVTIPSDAVTGNSRLRIVGSDAWGAHPGPLGGTWKGFSIDFPVEIIGDNAQRKPAPTYKELADQGEVDEPEGLSAIGDITVDGISTVQIIDNVAHFTNVESAWFYDVNGRMVKYVADASADVNVGDLASGVYVVKMINGNTIRSAKVVVK